MSCFPFVLSIFIGKGGDSALDEVGALSLSLFQAHLKMSTKVHLHSPCGFAPLFFFLIFKGASVLLFKLGLRVNTSTPYLLLFCVHVHFMPMCALSCVSVHTFTCCLGL